MSRDERTSREMRLDKSVKNSPSSPAEVLPRVSNGGEYEIY